jgi:hypothetical protein
MRCNDKSSCTRAVVKVSRQNVGKTFDGILHPVVGQAAPASHSFNTSLQLRIIAVQQYRVDIPRGALSAKIQDHGGATNHQDLT